MLTSTRADSIVYRAAFTTNTSVLTLTPVQTYKTFGAHGWDQFHAHGRHLLVVCNYYQCGQSRGAPPANCNSTVIYRWSPGTTAHVLFQSIPTSGPAQTDHFCINHHDGTENCYLVVGENFGTLHLR
jgi:hypothetical protein